MTDDDSAAEIAQTCRSRELGGPRGEDWPLGAFLAHARKRPAQLREFGKWELRMAEEQEFEIVLAHLDGYARVKLRGDLDYPTTIEHAEALQAVTDLRTRVVLDVADVNFVDSAGVAYLVRLAQNHDGPMRLENVPSPVKRLLDLTGLADMFEFVSD